MKIFKWKRRSTIPATQHSALREFVYLDQVSVYSLTSAPDAPPPTSMSETTGWAENNSITPSLGGGIPKVASAEISGKMSSSRTGERQIQRQFNVQSQFARLHKTYGPTFLLAASAGDTKIKTPSSLEGALHGLAGKRRAIRASELTRGSLAELRVALRAHPTFDITAFMQLIANLAAKYPELLQIPSMSEIRSTVEAGEFLAELLDDLVPIEGQSASHQIVTDSDGEVWVAEIAALNAVWDSEVCAEPLRIVGVAETNSFWKDTRRVLHAEAEFDILGRVSRTGLQKEWTPVKMIETFRRVMPSAADDFMEAIQELNRIPETPSASGDHSAVLAVAGAEFSLKLANHHNLYVEPLTAATLASLRDDGTLEGRLSALNRIADEFYAGRQDLHRDENVVGAIREDAWRTAQQLADLQTQVTGNSTYQEPGPVLELEFIGMYW